MSTAASEGQITEPLYDALACPRFEVIPIRGVDDQVVYLLPGATVTVTCSPSKGIENTLAQSEALRRAGFHVVPHISARLVSGEPHLREIVQRLDFLDLREIFVIGGDAREAAGPYTSALELLDALAALSSGVERIGVAAYPEAHPLVDDMKLEQALWEKQRYASYIVTQICFDADVTQRWLAQLRQDGIVVPVYIGLPGVVERKHLLGISLKIGVGDSSRFVAKHGNLVRMLVKPHGYDPSELVMALAATVRSPQAGVAGFHLNTFNQVESTEEWRLGLLARLARDPGSPPSGRAHRETLKDVC